MNIKNIFSKWLDTLKVDLEKVEAEHKAEISKLELQIERQKGLLWSYENEPFSHGKIKELWVAEIKSTKKKGTH